jgi:hypothetical protein
MRGVLRNHAIIVEPPSARLLWYLFRLSPALALRVTERLARTVNQSLVRSNL